MQHIAEDDMIRNYYEEVELEILEHLESCLECQTEYGKIKAVLDATRNVDVPDPGKDYPASIWSRIESELGTQESTAGSKGTDSEHKTSQSSADFFALPSARRLGWLAAALVLAVGSYTLGRLQDRVVTPAETLAAVEADPQAILKVALVGHFERSRQLLREVSNVQVVSDSTLAQQADRLLADNRLFRMVAQTSNDPILTLTLEELERWFLDVAHLKPETASLGDIKRRQRRRGLLLKLEILDNNLDRNPQSSVSIDPLKGTSHGTSI